MSLRHVKEQVAMLRDEIGRQSGREWITVAIPCDAVDETVSDWLDRAIGVRLATSCHRPLGAFEHRQAGSRRAGAS